MAKNKYMYGSRVYGTATETSDHDYIVVDDEQVEPKIDIRSEEGDTTSYSLAEFIKQAQEHEISVLECLCLPPEFILQLEIDIPFPAIDPTTLRNSFSKKASNSWVKAKKKLAEGDVLTAQKSLFHALRIPAYGCQLIRGSNIHCWGVSNRHLKRVKELPLDWAVWDAEFRAERNSINSALRELAPKPE